MPLQVKAVHVFPIDIEDVAIECPNVADVAVFGTDDLGRKLQGHPTETGSKKIILLDGRRCIQ